MKQSTNAVKGIITLLCLLLFSFTSTAQKAKEHYVLHHADSKIDAATYKQALDNKELDGFRFLDKRRIIKFEGSATTVELYSAKELLDLYGKQISPLTIKNSAAAQQIEFIIFPEQKAIKEKLVK
jgi:hypothetical protein